MSNPAVAVTNMDIGPCQVFFDGNDLGGTLDNVVVNFKYMKSPLKADQYGETLLDEAISGIEVTIETSFAETRDKDILALLFPNATKIVDGGQTALQFDNKVPTRQLALAKVLRLHPLVEADASEDYDWTFYKSISSEESSYTHGPTEQAKLKIVWKVYLDTSTTPARMFRLGDKDVA